MVEIDLNKVDTQVFDVSVGFPRGERYSMEIIDIAENRARVVIDRDQLLILNAALNEVCNALPQWEFETRMGAGRGTVLPLLKEIGSLIEQMDASSGG